MKIPAFAPATARQTEYIAILFNDCGFNSTQKADFIQSRFHRRYSDELTRLEASQLIKELQELKSRMSDAEKAEGREDEDEDIPF